MKKRDFKRILFEKTEHFTIDGIPFARSGADAQSLIGIGNCASFATTLRRAMLVADMDEDTREMALRILDRAERKEHRHEPKVALRRRAVIAAVATVVLSYFTLVPQGRAFAKSVYEFVVNFFENGIIVVENENSPDDGSYGFSAEGNLTPPPSIVPEDNNHQDRTVTTTYRSIEEFVEAVGKNPLILNNPDAKITQIKYIKNDEFGSYTLDTYYEYHDYKFWICQDWSTTGSAPYLTGTDEYFYKDFMDKQIICSIDSRKGTLDGLLILDDCKVTFTTENLPEAEALYDDLALYQPEILPPND